MERTRRWEAEGGGGRAKGKDRSRSSRQARANSKIVVQAPGRAGESRERGQSHHCRAHTHPSVRGQCRCPQLFSHTWES